MADKILNGFEVWISAQGLKSKGRLRSVDNISLEGVKRFRELILELAALGKLVAQDFRDEPASALLKKIEAEKKSIIKGGVIKDDEAIDKLSIEDSNPLPKGWQWESLGNITSVITDGTHHTPKYIHSGVPFISVKDIDGRTISFDDCKYISLEEHELINKRCNPERGDILLCRIGTLGRATIVDTDRRFSLFVSVGLIKFFQDYITPRYLHLILNSPILTRQYEKIKAGGSHTNKLNLGDIPYLIIPIAPLAEQHRIVAKVDELMALCDELEQQETHHLKSHQLLVETLLGTLTRATDAADFQQAWNKLQEHFDDLFTTEDSIDQLKQTILQLAVMGKLVPQDPNDEPASELLKRIAKEKERLVKEGKVIKQPALAVIDNSEKPFNLPSGWEWTRLGNLAADIHYGYTASANEQLTDIRLLRITDIQDDSVNWATVPGCEIEEEKAERYLLENGDILIARTGGTIGKSYLVKNIGLKAVFASYLIRVKRLESTNPEFIKVVLGSKLYWDQLFENSMGTGQPNVNGNALKNLVIPLPPLKEQHHIVHKVEHLFALCDRLKERIADAQKVANQMAEAVVEQA